MRCMLCSMLATLILGVEIQAAMTAKTLELGSFSTDSEVQSAWHHYEGGLPVQREGKAVKLPYDVKPSHARAFWDLTLNHDLRRYDRFTFDFLFDDGLRLNPTCNVYFQAEGGWYSATFPVEKGWNKVSLSKAEFGVEGSPAGWKKITAMRVGGWKSADGPGMLGIASIKAEASSVAVILGDRTPPTSPEFATVVSQAQTVAKALDGAGIKSGGLTDHDVEEGALEGRKIAVFPHNPHMTEKEVEEVEKFIKGGGRVMAFYSVHPRLLNLLGIEVTAWRPQAAPGEYSSIKLDTTILPDLPSSVAQASWNTNVFKTIRPDAKVIGSWHNAKGESTGIPALSCSNAGAYMGHVLLADDLAGKEAMLLGLFGTFDPTIWRDAMASARAKAVQVAEFKDLASAKAALGAAALSDVERQIALADLARDQNKPSQAVKGYAKAQEALVRAYMAGQPSKANELRAAWCHAADGVPGRSWLEVNTKLAANGFNAVFPNMLWGGRAYYPSRFLPVDESVETAGDQIKLCLEAGKKAGIKVHVWKVNWNLVNAPQSFIQQMRKEGRTQKDAQGKDLDWLCPSHLANYQLEKDSMLEVAKNYPVDGIHFDYIRYPGYEGCYCEGCREKFEKLVGAKVTSWPQEVIQGRHRQQYLEFRRSNITRLVRSASAEARKIRPGIQISAAVFADWPACRDTVGQDWVQWLKDGLLDFVCPMDYTSSAGQYKRWMDVQSAAIPNPRQFVPGVGVTLETTMGADKVAQQIQLGRKAGSKGFILFNLNQALLDQTLPLLRLGITKK